MVTTKKSTISIEMVHYSEILKRLEDLSERVEAMQTELAARKHLDEMVLKDHEQIVGNGKPGFYQIRDKVLSWDNKINATVLLVVGNVLWQIIEKTL